MQRHPCIVKMPLCGALLVLSTCGGEMLAAAETGVVIVRDGAVKLTIVASEELFQGSGLSVREAGRKEPRLFADVAQAQLTSSLRQIDSKAQVQTLRVDAADVARTIEE